MWPFSTKEPLSPDKLPVPDNWTQRKGSDPLGKPMLVRVHTGYSKFKGVSGYGHHVAIAVPMIDTTRDGFPNPGETQDPQTHRERHLRGLRAQPRIALCRHHHHSRDPRVHSLHPQSRMPCSISSTTTCWPASSATGSTSKSSPTKTGISTISSCSARLHISEFNPCTHSAKFFERPSRAFTLSTPVVIGLACSAVFLVLFACLGRGDARRRYAPV